MKTQVFALAALCIAFTACEKNPRDMNRTDSTYASDSTGNSGMAGDQSQNSEDRNITKKIRDSIMQDDSLSTNAKNARVTTTNGNVTLKGQVNNEREKRDLSQKASQIKGVRNVENQLDILIIREE